MQTIARKMTEGAQKRYIARRGSKQQRVEAAEKTIAKLLSADGFVGISETPEGLQERIKGS